MTTTNVSKGGNFYVYTDDVYGEWSEPIYAEQEGIDPSLYFEGTKSYFMSNGHDKDGNPAILQCEIDIETGEKLSEPRALWGGTGGRYLESPHLYRIGDWYYLTVAEGGTEYGHMVTYARSKEMYGEYEPYPHNPVLTNRNLGGYEIQGIGHADLVEDTNGNWWIFHLGFRQISRWEPFHHLGRETFVMPVEFAEDGWFTVLGGITTKQVDTDKLNTRQRYDYTIGGHDRVFLRSFERDCYEFGESFIRIKSRNDTLNCVGSPAFVGFRQREFDTELTVTVKCNEAEAGISVYMDENHHYDLAVVNNYGYYSVKLMLNIGDIKHTAYEIPVGSGEVSLRITANPLNYCFFVNGNEVGTAQTRYLSSEVACGFTGVVLGLYSQYGSENEFNEFKNLRISYE
jgi:alpha-N-arabinofuranosidase